MDIFSTNVLMGVVQNLKRPPRFLLDRYFGTEFTDTSEEIHFDLIPGKRRVAPFVSPLVEGKIVDALSRVAKTFKPAYVKPKTPVDANAPFKRAIGEVIGGNLAPAQRQQAAVAAILADHVDQIDRRLELMASEALRTAANVITGPGYPSTTVTYGRAAGNTIAALTSTARWGQSAAVPLDNLADWGAVALQASGAFGVDVIMGTTAWSFFKKDPTVKDRLLSIKGAVGTSLAQNPLTVEGGMYMGTIDSFNIFVYGGWYVDDNGVEQPIWPLKSVWVGSAAVEGVRAFGAIRDEASGFVATPYFPKSWVENDPSQRMVMTQSAPLTVPTRPDATVYNSDVVG